MPNPAIRLRLQRLLQTAATRWRMAATGRLPAAWRRWRAGTTDRLPAGWQRWRPLAAFAALALVAVLLFATAPQPEAVLNELPPLVVEAHTVQRRDLAPHATYAGRLQPRRRAELRFEVSGLLRERRAEPGMRAAAGDTLLALDDRDFRDRAQAAQAELKLEESRIKRDRTQLEQAKRQRDLQQQEATRHAQLGARSLQSRSALNAAEQKLANMASQVAQLEHAVRTAEQRLTLKRTAADRAARELERTRLAAPFDGQVNTVAAEVGDRITGDRVIATFVDVTALDFYTEVDSATAAALRLEQGVPVEVGGRTRIGTLVAMQTDPDAGTFTHAVRIRIPGGGALPGQIAVAQLALPPLAQALTVPVESVRVDSAEHSVYVIRGARLQKVVVALGPRVGEWQVIEAALNEGDRIVARDVAAMDERRAVQVRSAP